MARVTVMRGEEHAVLGRLRRLAAVSGAAVVATSTGIVSEMTGTLTEKMERLRADGVLAGGQVHEVFARHDDWCPAIRSKASDDCRCDPEVDIVTGGTEQAALADELLRR